MKLTLEDVQKKIAEVGDFSPKLCEVLLYILKDLQDVRSHFEQENENRKAELAVRINQTLVLWTNYMCINSDDNICIPPPIDSFTWSKDVNSPESSNWSNTIWDKFLLGFKTNLKVGKTMRPLMMILNIPVWGCGW